MTLVADVELARGALAVQASLRVDRGEVVALVGPNGAGKSTVLRAIAGLEPLDGGAVTMSGEVWDQPPRAWIPPARRRCGLLASEPLLFSHLDVLRNVAFGPRAAGRARRPAHAAAREWLDRVGAGSLAQRRPSTLSTGEAQCVALARTLASRPAVLLLDEPLASIDVDGRLSLRRDLSAQLRDFDGPTLIVTHDPLDAMALADRIVVLEGGRVTQDGRVDDVTRAPRSAWAATMVGVNLYRGSAHRARIALAEGGELTATGAADGPVLVVVHPRAVALHVERPEGSPRNVWRAQVTDVQRVDDGVRVSLTGEPPIVAQVTPAAVTELGLVPGRAVWASVKASEVRAVPD